MMLNSFYEIYDNKYKFIIIIGLLETRKDKI